MGSSPRSFIRCSIAGLALALAALIPISPARAVDAGAAAPMPKPVDPRCEYLKDPLGIDVAAPRLSWKIDAPGAQGVVQSAYQVMVASSEALLGQGKADLWDSGKVETGQSVHVAYAGKPLASRMRCYWRVRIWTPAGTSESATAMWSMGLLQPGDWQAQWIGRPEDPAAKDGKSLPAHYVRKEFSLPAGVRRATAYVCGLGFFELFINGQKVGDHLMDPPITLYTRRAFYVTFDVTKDLQKGANAVGVTLGSGRYYWRGYGMNFGLPRLLLQIEAELDDGTLTRLLTDGSWSFTDQGPIRANQEYDGEQYDARMEMTGWDKPGFAGGAHWRPAGVLGPEKSPLLQAPRMEPMRVAERLKPVSITPSPKAGAWIVDFGRNFYGNVKLRVRGNAGDKVSMTAAYSLEKDGNLQTANNRSAKCTDEYILKGGEVEEWHPSFVGRGFRRIEVTGFPGIPDASNFEALVIHTDFEEQGSFECSNQLINQIHQNYLRTARSYLRSLPMDPDRDERQGWTGDTAKALESQLWDFGVAPLYSKWLDDHRYDQKPNGQLPLIVPSLQPWNNPDVLWPATMVLIPETLHDYYGDTDAVVRNYHAIKGFVDFGHLLKDKEGVIPDAVFGDWCDVSATTPRRKRGKQNASADRYECGATAGGLLSTAYQYHHERILERFAKLLGKNEDAVRYGQQAEATRAAFNAHYLDPATGIYRGGTQTGQALPLMFDMVPSENRDRVIAALVDDILIAREGHLSVGLIGTQWLMQALTKVGRPDVAYVLATQTTKPSWGYMVTKGATSIWERWDTDTGDRRMNSEMLLMLAGNLNAWFYQTLAGINVVPEEPGFKKILIKPQPLGDLTWVKASHDCPYGRIESNWNQDGQRFTLNVVIPPNTTATVVMPDGSTHEVGSGANSFQSPLKPFVAAPLDFAVPPARPLQETEGYITSWMITSPFYQGVEAAALFDTPFAPESPGGKAAWLCYQAPQLRGPRIMNLGKVFDGFEHVIYLKSLLHAAKDSPATMEISAQDRVKIWVNGEPVPPTATTPPDPGKQLYAVTLRKGENTLLLKALQMKPEELDIAVRLRAADGGELRDVMSRAK